MMAVVEYLPRVARISLDEVTLLGDPERLFFNVNAPEDLRIAEAMALR
jgi:hypothetical protein